MNKVTITEAIKMAGVSRSHFYKKYINNNEISVEIKDDKKFIDISELIRVFGSTLKVENKNSTQNTTGDSKNTPKTPNNNERIIELLENQVAELKTELKNRDAEAKNREIWLQNKIDELQNQQNNLLEYKNKRKKFLGMF